MAVSTAVRAESDQVGLGRTSFKEKVIMGTTPKRAARTAGVLYLLVGIFGGFAQAYVYPKMFAAGDAATTAANVIANAGLVRMGIVADLFQATVLVFLAIALYHVLKQVHQTAAVAMVILVVIGSGITLLNAVFELEGLRVAGGGAYVAAVGTAGSDALVLLLLDLQHNGLLIATIFYGLWLMPLGYLAYRSAGMLPKWLGVLLILGGACYLVDVLAQFLVPDFGQRIATFVVIPSALAEIATLGYLLVIGVKTPKPVVRTPAAA